MTATDVRSDWWSLAACQSADPEVFFPISSLGAGALQVDRAKAVCKRCRVRAECLTYALSSRQLHGVWGGTSEEERQLLARALPDTENRRLTAVRGTARSPRRPVK